MDSQGLSVSIVVTNAALEGLKNKFFGSLRAYSSD